MNLKSIIMNLNYWKDKHKNSLLELLQKYEIMFDGTLGRYTGSNYTIDLKEDAKPYHAKPFPIPKINKLVSLKKKVNRLIKIGVLNKINNSKKAAPTLIIPKINGRVRSIFDFRELNKRIKRQPFPIPNNLRFITQIRRF